MDEAIATHYPGRRSGLSEGKASGCFHVYYGEGVGKTTRAIGLAVRAAGHSLKVAFVPL
jgi:ATP:corrinoid adenosyltransferase